MWVGRTDHGLSFLSSSSSRGGDSAGAFLALGVQLMRPGEMGPHKTILIVENDGDIRFAQVIGQPLCRNQRIHVRDSRHCERSEAIQ